MSKRTVLTDVQTTVDGHKSEVLAALEELKKALENTITHMANLLYESVPASKSGKDEV